MIFDLQDKLLTAFFVLLAAALALALLGRGFRPLRGRMWRILGAVQAAMLCVAAQLVLNLSFLICYALFVKNGYTPSLSDLGVAFIGLSAGLYCLLWRCRALPSKPVSLLPFAAYSVFLAYRFFFAKGLWGRLSYLIANPLFGFIGGESAGPLGVLGALLPFACAALGRGLAGVDKSSKI